MRIRTVVLVGLLGLVGVGCTIKESAPTPAQQRNQRQNLREVRGNIDQFQTEVGDPEGLGQIPPGRR